MVSYVTGSCGSSRWCLVCQVIGNWYPRKVSFDGRGDFSMVKLIIL